MEVIPAIDLKGGRCVRLYQGDYRQETVFSEDPVGLALYWSSSGAPRLHLVDLDGAAKGQPCHTLIISEIVKAIRRDPQHLAKYLFKELAVPGSAGQELVLQGKIDDGSEHVRVKLGARAKARTQFREEELGLREHLLAGLGHPVGFVVLHVRR